MNSENLCGPALISIGSFQNALYKFLFKLVHCLFEQYASFNHHSNERFQLVFQVTSLQADDEGNAPPRRRY